MLELVRKIHFHTSKPMVTVFFSQEQYYYGKDNFEFLEFPYWKNEVCPSADC